MNRHIVIGFKKGSSYKRDLGDVIDVVENLKVAKKLAADVTQGKDAKYVSCTIHNCKIPRARIGCKSVKAVVTTIKDVKDAEAKAEKVKEPKTKKK